MKDVKAYSLMQNNFLFLFTFVTGRAEHAIRHFHPFMTGKAELLMEIVPHAVFLSDFHIQITGRMAIFTRHYFLVL